MSGKPEGGQAASLDEVRTLKELKKAVAAFARERDWERFHAPKNLSMAMAAEAGELMEHFLWADAEQSHQTAKNSKEVADELADVVIYALEFANITGLDLASAIEAKMGENARKYPVEKARGNSRKYTEL